MYDPLAELFSAILHLPPCGAFHVPLAPVPSYSFFVFSFVSVGVELSLSGSLLLLLWPS